MEALKKQLKLGKMTSREMAEWFGVTYNSYRTQITKYLDILKDYAVFDKVYGGVVIHEIIKVRYNGKINKEKVRQQYLEIVLESNEGLCSVSGIADLTEQSRRQITEARNELFGEVPTNIDPNAKPGTCGTRSYVWAIKEVGINNYRYLTEDEDTLFSGLIQQTYNNIDPELAKKESLIGDYCLKENLSYAEYKQLITTHGCDFFEEVILKFRDRTGYQLVRATKHVVEESIRK